MPDWRYSGDDRPARVPDLSRGPRPRRTGAGCGRRAARSVVRRRARLRDDHHPRDDVARLRRRGRAEGHDRGRRAGVAAVGERPGARRPLPREREAGPVVRHARYLPQCAPGSRTRRSSRPPSRASPDGALARRRRIRPGLDPPAEAHAVGAPGPVVRRWPARLRGRLRGRHRPGDRPPARRPDPRRRVEREPQRPPDGRRPLHGDGVLDRGYGRRGVAQAVFWDADLASSAGVTSLAVASDGGVVASSHIDYIGGDGHGSAGVWSCRRRAARPGVRDGRPRRGRVHAGPAAASASGSRAR